MGLDARGLNTNGEQHEGQIVEFNAYYCGPFYTALA